MESKYVNLGQCSTKKEVVYTHKGLFQNIGYTVLTPSCGGSIQNIDLTEVNPGGYIMVLVPVFFLFLVYLISRD
jgi:hypothetical protein